MDTRCCTTWISLAFHERKARNSALLKDIVSALVLRGNDITHDGGIESFVALGEDKDGLKWQARINTLYSDTRMFLLQDGKDAAFNGDGWREHADICRIFELTGDELLDALVAEFKTIREQITVYSR